MFYLAGEFAQHLQRQLQLDFPTKHEKLFTNEEVVCAQIAGLCHDLGKRKLYSLYLAESQHHAIAWYVVNMQDMVLYHICLSIMS